VEAVRDPSTGKRRQAWHSGFKTRKDAEKGLSEILSRLDRGTYVQPSKLTVTEYLDDWLAAITASVRPSTWESYERNLRVHVKPRLGSTQLQGLTASMLNALYAELLLDGRSKQEKGLSPRTVRYIHTILRKALKDAVRWNHLARNVADSADPPKPRSGQARLAQTWTAPQLRRFLDHVKGDRLYPAYLLAATTGMRRGEIAGLRWQDIDFDTSRVAIRQTLIVIGYQLRWSTPKTDRGRRNIAIDPATMDALRSHRAAQAAEKLVIGPDYADADLVFAGPSGTPTHPEALSAAFERHSKAAGLPRIRFHDLRHTHATLALQAGIHPKIVSERLGHADIALTLNTYSHAIPALEETAAAVVADLVLGSS
jgi:integrase